MVVTRGWQGEEGELVFNGHRVQFGKMKKFWRWIVVILQNNMNVLNDTEL